ncbi:MAG: S41 family peptidase [Chloroflexi bacterium]|nr:S41 family peptidase [Chloroflexota bacterium]
MSDQNPAPLPTTPPERPVVRRSSPVTWVVSLVLASVLGSLLFAGGYLAAGGASRDGSCAAPTEAFAALCEAYDKLKQQYVDKLDDTQLAEGAIRGLFEYGVKDPFSGYMSPDEYQRALGSLSGEFTGIGAEMAVKNTENPEDLAACPQLSEICTLVVVAPLADSPAEAAGLESGDVVLAVDGETVNGSTLQDEAGKLRGEPGTKVTLTVRRGERTFDLTITRAKIVQREVTSRMLDGKIGYIALHGFSQKSADEFRTSLQALLDDGAVSIIFDLRHNHGGYIDAAQKIASEFIGSGLIFSQESSGGEKKPWEATGNGLATDPKLPLAVLVNGGSASASEIVAAALKETGRGVIIGQPTYGKNTVQVWTELVDQSGVRITISRWFTPKHNSVAPDGVQPDITIEVPDGTPPDQDPVLDRAITELTAPAALIPWRAAA